MTTMPDATSGYLVGSIPDWLMPLVTAGYKHLASRAAEGVKAWRSVLPSGAVQVINDKLAPRNLPESPKLYVVTGGETRRGTSGNLLEEIVSTAIKDLSRLADMGNVALIDPKSFGSLFFALDSYGVFKQQFTVHQCLELAMEIAVSNYRAVGGGEFVRQLEVLQTFGQIMVSDKLRQVADYTEGGSLTLLVFRLSPKAPSVLNILNSLKLLYTAANVVLKLQQEKFDDAGGLRERITNAAAEVYGVPSSVATAYFGNGPEVQGVAAALGQVSLHRGVEALIEGWKELPFPLKRILMVANVLDTVRTGRISLYSNKPYSDAIGLAEVIG